MKINQFKAITQTGQKSGIVVGKKTGDEIQDIAVFDGGNEDNNMKLMMDLKKFASQQETEMKQNEKKFDWKKELEGAVIGSGTGVGSISGGIGTLAALEIFFSGAAYFDGIIPIAAGLTTIPSGPAGVAAFLTIMGGMAGGGYIGYKLSKGVTKILGVDSEKQAEQKN